MKKLIMTVAIVCAAVCAQAAATKWTASNIYNMNATDKVASGTTVYLFNTATLTQAELVAAFANGDDYLAKSIGTAALTGAGTMMNKVAEVTGTTAGASAELYFAILSDDYMYVSTAKTVTMSASETTATGVSVGTQLTFSQAAAKDASAGYQTAGWYQAVPEPTSGLLMLLGMAGLALRRRRA